MLVDTDVCVPVVFISIRMFRVRFRNSLTVTHLINLNIFQLQYFSWNLEIKDFLPVIHCYARQRGKHKVAALSVRPSVRPSVRYLVRQITLKLMLAFK